MLAKTETNVPALSKMNDIYIKIHNATKTMHSNQTGCFPETLSRGNKSIMVLVDDAEPMKNNSAGEMIKAYLAL
jgi:hypothetical protein